MTTNTLKKNRGLQITNTIANNKAIIILLFLWIVMSFASKNFLSGTNLINIVKQCCVSTVISLGMTIAISSGNMDLSVGTLLGLSGIVMALLSRDLHLPTGVVIAAGLGVGALGGLLNGVIYTQFKLNPFIVTLATQNIFAGVGYILCGNKAVNGLSEAFIFLGQGKLLGIPMLIVIMAVCLAIVAVMMYKTKIGRQIVAVGGNREAARVSGINVKCVGILVYLFTGLCAGVSAVMLTARTAAASTTGGAGMEMDAICAVVLGGTSLAGGKANVFGTLLGCLIVGTITNGLTLLRVDSNWQVVAKGIIIILAVVIDVETERLTAKRALAAMDK